MPSEALMMTVKDVADACQLSETAVRRAVHDGELQAVKLRSRLRITRQAFDAWIMAQRQPAASVPDSARTTRHATRAQRPAPNGSFRALVDTHSVRTQAQ
jgi:excisionase family DNA binding protein